MQALCRQRINMEALADVLHHRPCRGWPVVPLSVLLSCTATDRWFVAGALLPAKGVNDLRHVTGIDPHLIWRLRFGVRFIHGPARNHLLSKLLERYQNC